MCWSRSSLLECYNTIKRYDREHVRIFIALLFLDLVTQNKIYIQGHNNMDLLILNFFTKFYSLRNSGLQVTDIQKKKM